MRILSLAALGALLIAPILSVRAAENTALGTWKTIDDDSHEAKALVEIAEHDGVLSGRIVQLFRKPGEEPDPVCKKCEGERHGQRVIGMTILTGMRRDGDVWDGGEILDPEEGKTYRCKLHPTADGRKLEVRGFIGISLLGRTQVWERAEDDANANAPKQP
ncbi:MAG TPA: DUF2147 domain-containing protein [Rudaea sp.]